jgi:hypothetical protein
MAKIYTFAVRNAVSGIYRIHNRPGKAQSSLRSGWRIFMPGPTCTSIFIKEQSIEIFS